MYDCDANWREKRLSREPLSSCCFLLSLRGASDCSINAASLCAVAAASSALLAFRCIRPTSIVFLPRNFMLMLMDWTLLNSSPVIPTVTNTTGHSLRTNIQPRGLSGDRMVARRHALCSPTCCAKTSIISMATPIATSTLQKIRQTSNLPEDSSNPDMTFSRLEIAVSKPDASMRRL